MARRIYKVNVKTPGLDRATEYLRFEYLRAAQKVGDTLQDNVREKQRKDTGEERRRTLVKVTSKKTGLNVLVSVYNTSIQGAVDELGAKPHFPPFKVGSKLFGWVSRKGLANTRSKSELTQRARATRRRVSEEGGDAVARQAAGAFRRAKDENANIKRIERVSFLVARAISRRGLPRPGDPLRAPFETVRKESRAMINQVFNYATLLAVKKINDETRRGGKK